jgi:hypothetical protein
MRKRKEWFAEVLHKNNQIRDLNHHSGFTTGHLAELVML